MSWKDCQILNFETVSSHSPEAAFEVSNSQLLLDWIVENSFFKSEVFESDLDIAGQKYFRFSIVAKDSEGVQYSGLGRSTDRLTAASIAAGEVVERYAAKKVLKSAVPFSAKHLVNVDDGEISVSRADVATDLPTSGFHSSNGWAVHFSLKNTIEKSVMESLERHTLLYSYLKNGWNGFEADAVVPFNGQKLTPYVSNFSFGGFGAGLVATEGDAFPGRTFGYLCDEAEMINGSQKWMGAFFESYGQWEALAASSSLPDNANFLSIYQQHFLTHPHSSATDNAKAAGVNDISKISANLLVLDLKKALELPVQMYAAYSFGGNLIPLFFKQKLSADETKNLQLSLAAWELPIELPEYHPIL